MCLNFKPLCQSVAAPLCLLGETMHAASSEFADDPCSSVKRGTMVRAARALLSAVTRLLILADMADVMRLLAHLKIVCPSPFSLSVEEALEAVKNATNEQDLANRFKEFGKEMVKLNYVAARRQQELKDPQCRDEMAAARGALKKNATMLYTASQAFLRHPDVAATRANRDYVFKQVQEAIAGISSSAQASSSPTDEKHGHAGIGELAAALNEFDNCGLTWCASENSSHPSLLPDSLDLYGMDSSSGAVYAEVKSAQRLCTPRAAQTGPFRPQIQPDFVVSEFEVDTFKRAKEDREEVGSSFLGPGESYERVVVEALAETSVSSETSVSEEQVFFASPLPNCLDEDAPPVGASVT
ncbi:hypothetical protein JZ751_005968 [Albula glossodonta]|uniref:Catenin alpha-2 n=1 Tax=Albula glossodonta TaxID=121402 RepID=A0A8T2P6Z8_9TELE|nr:hypothetical protein JZ751_005968 [Albula glossodonta]